MAKRCPGTCRNPSLEGRVPPPKQNRECFRRTRQEPSFSVKKHNVNVPLPAGNNSGGPTRHFRPEVIKAGFCRLSAPRKTRKRRLSPSSLFPLGAIRVFSAKPHGRVKRCPNMTSFRSEIVRLSHYFVTYSQLVTHKAPGAALLAKRSRLWPKEPAKAGVNRLFPGQRSRPKPV